MLPINPLSPNVNMHLLHTVLRMVPLEKFFFCNATTFHLWIIISLILMTCLFDQAVLLLGEIGCESLLGLKGAVSRNSAKLGNYKMPVKLRET